MADHLDSILWLPFLEPAILRHNQLVTWSGPSFSKESYAEDLRLAKVWSQQGLLSLFHEEHASGMLLKARSVEMLEKAEETYCRALMRRRSEAKKSSKRLVRRSSQTNNAEMIGTPASKRIPLIALSLKAAELLVITRGLAARLSVIWVSVFMYRRSLCCVLSKIFDFGPRALSDSDDVVMLSREVAEEIVRASVFGLLAMTDVLVDYDRKIMPLMPQQPKVPLQRLRSLKRLQPPSGLSVVTEKGPTLCWIMRPEMARRALRAVGIDRDAEVLSYTGVLGIFGFVNGMLAATCACVV
eukprot:s1543_g16.t1